MLVFLAIVFTMFVVKYFPDDNGAVVVVVVIVVVVVVLGYCIVMDILFCYCCKRKERYDQDNGMYMTHVLCTYVYMCVCMYI